MRSLPWAAIISLISLPAGGVEAPCSSSSSKIGCFDAAPSPGPAEPSPFHWFGRGRVLDYGQVAGTFVLRYAASPAELFAPSPDPSGRMVPVVRYTTRIDLRFALGLGRGIDLTFAQPLAVSQAGAGPDALLSQDPVPLVSNGFGDPRLSLRMRLPEDLRYVDWAMRLEVTVPTGNERGYLGDRSMTEAAALNAHWSRFGVSLVTDLGLRVARTTRFGGVALGTHAFWGFGVDYAPFSRDWLHVSLEALLRPTLVPSPTERAEPDSTDAPNQTPSTHASLVMPAEWMVKVSSRPLAADLWLSVGGGMALPLSHRDGSDARVDAWFVAPSAPRYQLLASVAALY